MSRARVIKSGQARSTQRRPSVAKVLRAHDLELQRRAEELLQEARAAAAKLLDEARGEAQQLQQQVCRAAEEQAAQIVLAAQRLADRQLARARADLTRLGVGIAEKILGATLELDPARVADVVAQVLRVAGRSGRFVARVHPQDLPLVEARRAQLAGVVGSAALELRADASVARGGAILETDRGVVDGRVEVQLATLAAALLDDAEAQDTEAQDTGAGGTR